MSTQFPRFLAGICLVLLVASSNVMATPPESQIVVFSMHEDPQDPESDVVFRVTLSLALDSFNTTSIGWAVSEAQFETVGASPILWSVENPALDTQDGLWWTDHADVDAPVITEFLVPPYMEGEAVVKGTQGANLDYAFGGNTYVPPEAPATPPYGSNTASASFSFFVQGESVSLAEGEDEPVETGDGAGGAS